MGLSGAFILCAFLVILSLLLHFKNDDGLQKLSVWLGRIQFGLLGLAVLALLLLLQLGAYEYELVFNSVESAMSPLERLGGLWSGQASSLLFFSFLLSGAAVLAVRLALRLQTHRYIPTILLVLQTTLLFFILPDVFFVNPFVKIWGLPSGAITSAVFPPSGASLLVAADGQGMNPSLRHVAMLLHPPALYLGLIGFFIPYAFMLAGLAQRDRRMLWVKPLYPLVLASWVFLTLGMLLGSWWAYSILGWGGYWGWDAVELSGLIPWLLSFGLLHSMSMQQRGYAYRSWIYTFTASITILTLFGILITRSGVLESVHAYTSGAMGPLLTVLIVMHLVFTIGLLFSRRKSAVPIAAAQTISLSDEITRLFNLCLLGLVLVCLFGQTLPLTSQLFGGAQLSLTAQQYEQLSAPLFMLLLLLSGLCPLAPLWNISRPLFGRILAGTLAAALLIPLILQFSRPLKPLTFIAFWAAAFALVGWLFAFIRTLLLPIFNHQKGKPLRLGIFLIHVGLAVMAFGIIGVESFSQSQDLQLRVGESARVNDYSFEVLSAGNRLTESANVAFESTLQITHPSGQQSLITPAIIHYTKLGSLSAQPGDLPGLLQDVQVILQEVPEPPNRVLNLQINFFPLMSWIWYGGILMAAGGLVSWLSRKYTSGSKD